MTSDAWNNLTIAAGHLEQARTRLFHAAVTEPAPQKLGHVFHHLDDVIADVAAMLSKIVELQNEDRLDRARYDREVAEDLRSVDGDT